jgi:hypothetical protein
MEPLSANDPHAVGEFQLRARLGAGGMGQVYLGFSPAGRAVAVKVVHAELARDAEFRQRFAREVASARAVSGMYTAAVVAAGLDDDPPWLATAYVPGPSLADLVARHGALPEPAVWRLAAGLAEALRAVHACGLVHRDLKPANVLLAGDGPHVIDFGISRAFEGTTVTAAGMVVGTPGYMSPEQAEGKQAGPASDVFSLGCLLAFAITGTAPFGGGSAASVLYRVVTAQPDLTGVPVALRDVIAACLAKDPARRPDVAALGAMISQAGPAVTATLTSFWPGPVAEIIRAAAAAYPATVSAGAVPAVPSAVSAAPAAQGLTGAGVASASVAQQPGITPGAQSAPGTQSAPGAQTGRGPAGMVPDGYYAAATASMTRRAGETAAAGLPAGAGAPVFGAPGRGAPGGQGIPGGPGIPGGQGGSGGQGGFGGPGAGAQSAPWPPSGGQAQWPRQPGPRDALSQYTPAPRQQWQPTSVVTAVWLMYGGAALTLLGMIIDLAVISQVRKNYLADHPFLTPSGIDRVNSIAGVGDLAVIIGCLLGIGLWVTLAVAARNGRGWTRTVGTVLFGLDTLVFIGTVGRPGIQGIKTIHLLIWLVGLLAVIFLWQRKSSQFFLARRQRR